MDKSKPAAAGTDMAAQPDGAVVWRLLLHLTWSTADQKVTAEWATAQGISANVAAKLVEEDWKVSVLLSSKECFIEALCDAGEKKGPATETWLKLQSRGINVSVMLFLLLLCSCTVCSIYIACTKLAAVVQAIWPARPVSLPLSLHCHESYTDSSQQPYAHFRRTGLGTCHLATPAGVAWWADHGTERGPRKGIYLHCPLAAAASAECHSPSTRASRYVPAPGWPSSAGGG
jgi:hypothetical protein